MLRSIPIGFPVKQGGEAMLTASTPPHILIPQGIERAVGRLRAAYSDQDFIFQDSLQSLTVPTTDRRDAKLLTGILNSRLAGWFYFHETANLGTDRAKILQTELFEATLCKAAFDA